MKITPFPCLAACLCILALHRACADPEPIDPNAKTNAEQEAEDQAKNEEDDQKKKNWLLESYQKQMQAKNADSDSKSNNIYDEISSNKELAHLALLPMSDATGSSSVKPRAGLPRNGLSLRADGAAPTKTPTYKPILVPLSSSFNFSTPSLYSTMLGKNGTSAPKPAPTVAPSNSDPVTHDPSAVEIPGMTAAESRINQGTLSLDISSLDALPEEPAHQTLKDPNGAATLPSAPVGNAATQLRLTVPGAAAMKPASDTLRAIPIPKVEDEPKAPLAPESGGRRPIQDPFDILN